MPTLDSFNLYNPETGEYDELKVSTKFTELKNTVTLLEDSSFVNIGISEFNPLEDTLEVTKNTVHMDENIDYILNGGYLRIENPSGVWKKDTFFSFRVLKNVDRSPLPSYDPSLFQDKAITKAKLAQELQDELDGVLAASIGQDNTLYATLKERLDKEYLKIIALLNENDGITPEERLKLANIEENAQVNTVTRVNLKTGDITLKAEDINTNSGQNLELCLIDKTTILIASGTANAIILNITLEDKSKYSFKAVADSTGAVTINGIALKKADGTSVSNLKANRIYDFYYDQAQNSVFILAKAEGNATVGNVLAGKTFSNGEEIGLIGTAPLKSGITYTPTTSDQIITSGFEDGTCKIKGDANLLANNIASGVKMFNVTGTLSNIKSIQRGQTLMNSTTVNIPISTVDLSKSIVLISISPANNAYYIKQVATMATLTSSTNLQLKIGSIQYPPTISWEVIEFNNVKSVQSGVKNMVATSSETISPVNMAKSFVVSSFWTNDSNAQAAMYYPNATTLTNSTTITFTQIASNVDRSVSWFVVEFN